MRFLMINLFLVCLFLFGIGYLAFGYDETETASELHAHSVNDASWDAALETFYTLLKTDVDSHAFAQETVSGF